MMAAGWEVVPDSYTPFWIENIERDEDTKLKPRILFDVRFIQENGAPGPLHKLSMAFDTDEECRAAMGALQIIKTLSEAPT